MPSVLEKIYRFGSDNPDKIALLNGKDSKTYGQMISDIVRSAQMLSQKFGINKGDRVILAADKQLEFVSAYFACHLLEAVALPIAPDTNPTRYDLIKSRVAPSLVIGFPETDTGLQTVGLDRFIFDDAPDPTHSFTFPDPEALADIIFTTGTTGQPKGVTLSHKNIAAAALNINTFIGNDTEDVEMLALPISHSFGLGRMRCALSNGQTVIMLGSFANVKRFFRFMSEYGVNGFGMVPASWALLKKLSGDELGRYSDQLHYIEIGSAPMPISEKKNLISLLPHTRICMHYGLTEASRSAFMEFNSESDRLDTVGRQSPNMLITIRDDEGNEVPDGEEGEICVEGDAVTGGYLGLPHDDYFWGDVFRTGDWGVRDGDGYIRLKSRRKELINVGGKKVSPIEVEDVLKTIDFIDDCVCVGIPDPEAILGEVVKAFIITGEPERIDKEAIDVMIGGRLEGYKHPVEYAVIDEIPKTSSGKIQRLLLK
ncbi:MAG: acyl--CoA ligase [Lachnospiraceae bacterium]|nr:acyl--CoA ligase [Lachnospiraceae bacterium]